MRNSKNCFWVALVLSGMAFDVAAARAGAPDSAAYTLGVVTQKTAITSHREWSPVIEHLTRTTGLGFELRVYSEAQEFEAELASGVPDFVYMNPYHQIVVRHRQAYVPLVRDGKNLLNGILVVPRDSSVQSIADLRGQIIAFPHPNAFGASLYMRALLSKQFGIDFEPSYVGNHPNVYRHVLRGRAAAGGGVNTTLAVEPDEVRSSLRVIFETPSVAPHPLSAHPRILPAHREAVIRALLKLARSDAGRRLLAAVNLPQPVRADYARDYQPLERLGLERYYDPTAEGGRRDTGAVK